MQTAPAHAAAPEVHLRPAVPADLDAMIELEQQAFTTDRISRRAFKRLLTSPSVAAIAAERDGRPVGYALVLFRNNSSVARLYSIAVNAHAGGRGIGTALLQAAEAAALEHGRSVLRLEVKESNARAIARYQKSGYRRFGTHHQYYEDGEHALRFEKRLTPPLRQPAPPYFHQTTEFTCGPACMLMALAWADPSFQPEPALEFKLWREATTIYTTSGPGGCDPFGLAVTLKHHGVEPELHVSRDGPYFIELARSADRRRVIKVTQDEFRREADLLRIPIHLAPLTESALIKKFETGAVAIVLVNGYRMLRRHVPHWVFAFGHEGRHILLHDPAARRDEHGKALERETFAISPSEFERMSRFGELRAAVVIRKGSLQ
jgi:ribosomal protein S18 acetylase RimI-like enzyme